MVIQTLNPNQQENIQMNIWNEEILDDGVQKGVINITKILMKYPIDYKDITVNTEFYSEIINVHKEATEYLADFTWCKKIIRSDIYLNLGATLCIFSF